MNPLLRVIGWLPFTQTFEIRVTPIWPKSFIVCPNSFLRSFSSASKPSYKRTVWKEQSEESSSRIRRGQPWQKRTRQTSDAPQTSETSTKGVRIAKALASLGIASRREAERIILEGRVSVDGKIITSPALNVDLGENRIAVDGKEFQPNEKGMWLHFKMREVLVSDSDPEQKGRRALFSHLRAMGLPKMRSIGGMEFNSEGLLLLTNDSEWAARLEKKSLPQKFVVRLRGQLEQEHVEELEKGIEIAGIKYPPIKIAPVRNQTSNNWMEVVLEKPIRDKNLRQILEHMKLQVNRMIRVTIGSLTQAKFGIEHGDVIALTRSEAEEVLNQ